MVGAEGLQRLHSAHVAVVGLGAVGSYATEALARAGVGRLRLVDFDVVHPSNINRQLYALESTLDRPKTEVAEARVRDINPACEVEALRVFVHSDTLGQVLAGPPDIVIDAIDSLGPKLELIATAITQGVPVISSMGAACRTDPTRVRTGLLTEVTMCPLARRVRKGLRRRELATDVPCVFSDEPVSPRFLAPPVADAAVADEQLERGRKRRVLGSLPTLTGIFGLTVANLALEILLGELFPRPASSYNAARARGSD
jgi:tRNA A37 threonylcarbamoyladenosine dehydratase